MSTDEKTAPQLGQDAVTPPTRDLGSLLAPRTRRPPTGPATRTGENQQPTDTQSGEDTDQDHTQGPPEAPAPARRPASAAADAHLRISRVVYLTDDLVADVGAACAKDRITRTQLVLQALEATHTHLGELIAQDLEPKVIHGTLFDEVVTTHRQNQPAKRQVMIQPTRAQLEVIDRLVTDSGARDRSHLVAVALAAHLANQRRP